MGCFDVEDVKEVPVVRDDQIPQEVKPFDVIKWGYGDPTWLVIDIEDDTLYLVAGIGSDGDWYSSLYGKEKLNMMLGNGIISVVGKATHPAW